MAARVKVEAKVEVKERVVLKEKEDPKEKEAAKEVASLKVVVANLIAVDADHRSQCQPLTLKVRKARADQKVDLDRKAREDQKEVPNPKEKENLGPKEKAEATKKNLFAVVTVKHAITLTATAKVEREAREARREAPKVDMRYVTTHV